MLQVSAKLAWELEEATGTTCFDYDERRQVLEIDVSKFQLLGSNRLQYVRPCVEEALAEQCLEATVKHGGGNTQAWGCISLQGIGDIIKTGGSLRRRSIEPYRKNMLYFLGIV
ncbi:hypothetical protein Trydic_g3638 [Trypoxylus dichotomus]